MSLFYASPKKISLRNFLIELDMDFTNFKHFHID
jgi:hypothetical protein